MPFMDAPEQEIEEDYRTAFELAGVGKAHVDLGTGRFTRVNAKCCEMTGNSAEELLGMTFKDLIHPDAQEEALKDFEKFVAGEISDYSVEWPCVCKDGKTMWAVRRLKGRSRTSERSKGLCPRQVACSLALDDFIRWCSRHATRVSTLMALRD